ncbi:urease accessory protein UreD [Solimonas soli]|uniref:urease accessory protein UreD n=1 Tax=Solimonas soli TaxID=413479 RepID=UPI0004BAD572|nr:urease accessory protein UreD [Solimonas soli]
MYDLGSSAMRTFAHQRVHGAAVLGYRRDEHGRTRLADLYQRAPCRLLFPDAEHDEPTQAVLLTTSGGLTGGDRLDFTLRVDDGARVVVSTQAAEKLYRALDEEADTRVDVHLRVGAGAWVEWLAQETILFDGARLRRRLDAELAPAARLLATESVVFGRRAMGEDWRRGLLHDAWRIRRDGRLIWADALHLAGDVAAARAAPFGFGDAGACATLLYAGDDAEAQLPLARALLADHPGAATAFGGLLIARLLAADAAALRRSLIHLAGGLRQGIAGLPARLPRVWYC